MFRPTTLVPKPSMLLLLLGGVVATLLFSALLYLAPAFGIPFVDFPRLIGGVFTGDANGALWLGYALFFFGGVFVAAPLLILVWPVLPGSRMGLGAALTKGASWGVALWVLSGMLLPLLGALTQVNLANPGFFAFGEGVAAALWVLLGQLLYGLALGIIATMSQGTEPLEMIGWRGHDANDLRIVLHDDPDRQPSGGDAPIYPMTSRPPK